MHPARSSSTSASHAASPKATPKVFREMEFVVLKWVFDTVILCEGKVKPGQRDWIADCSAHIEFLGYRNWRLTGPGAIHWKCPRHIYPFIGGYCPGLKSETIIRTNADVDEALSHCLNYGIFVLHLHVSHNPQTRQEINTADLRMIAEIQSDNRLTDAPVPEQSMPTKVNKRTPSARKCRSCQKAGHNKKTCRKRNRYCAASSTK